MPGTPNTFIDAAATRFDGSRQGAGTQDHRVPRSPPYCWRACGCSGSSRVAAVVQFERRVDETRRAQVVIAQLHNQQGGCSRSPSIRPSRDRSAPAADGAAPGRGEAVFSGSVATLAGLGNSDAPARIGALSRDYFTFIDRLSALVGRVAPSRPRSSWAPASRPGGLESRLALEYTRADAGYGADAARSRTVASIGTVIAIVFLLVAFSVAFAYSLRAAAAAISTRPPTR